MSGPRLGRPPKQVDRVQKKIEQRDTGEGKRIYGLGLIRTRLRETSETVIAMQLLVMNLEKRLRLFFG